MAAVRREGLNRSVTLYQSVHTRDLSPVVKPPMRSGHKARFHQLAGAFSSGRVDAAEDERRSHKPPREAHHPQTKAEAALTLQVLS